MAGTAKKSSTIDDLKSSFDSMTIAVVADYRGLTVGELTELRRELYQEKAQFTIAKNTLLRRVINGTSCEGLTPYLKGPTAVLFGQADQVKPVKILKDFLKKNKKTNELKGGFLDGKTLSHNDVEQLATLPPIEELRAQLLGGIASPLTGLVASLSGPQRSLVNVLDQYSKQKAG